MKIMVLSKEAHCILKNIKIKKVYKKEIEIPEKISHT